MCDGDVLSPWKGGGPEFFHEAKGGGPKLFSGGKGGNQFVFYVCKGGDQKKLATGDHRQTAPLPVKNDSSLRGNPRKPNRCLNLLMQPMLILCSLKMLMKDHDHLGSISAHGELFIKPYIWEGPRILG